MKHGPCNGWHSTKWSNDQCRICWNESNRDTYRGPRTPPKIAQRTALPVLSTEPAACAYRGELLRRPASCSKTWVYECAVHKECNRSKCESCADVRSIIDDDPYRRHLMYYVYPVASNDLWKRAIDNVTARLSLFNGRRVVAIATKSALHGLEDATTVRNYFGRDDADFMFVPHGARRLGEVTAFAPMMRRLERFVGPRDVTFYGHTKGVTKLPTDPSVHRWADMMYRANLDRWDLVRDSLSNFPITGAFRKRGRAFGGRVETHYTGTFYWFRNKDVFSRQWDQIPSRYGGTEMWPGLMFQQGEIGCHFYDATGHSLYHAPTIDMIQRELETWLTS